MATASPATMHRCGARHSVPACRARSSCLVASTRRRSAGRGRATRSRWGSTARWRRCRRWPAIWTGTGRARRNRCGPAARPRPMIWTTIRAAPMQWRGCRWLTRCM
ncbi:hypothetical protein G6F21_014589 [Rhizopus arrhizus]|nr:hypothetical protein G6F21_014589 [Rhizopus arrhizus]